MPKIIPIFRGDVKDGRLYVRDREMFVKYLRDLEGEIDITLKKHRKSRSLKQNAYYHSVIVPMLAMELGYTHDEMHEIIKAQFFKIPEKEVVSTNGVVITIPEHAGSTTDSTTIEFEEKMDEIRQWASMELGVYIPLPGEGLPENEA